MTTRAQVWAHIKGNVLALPDDHPVFLALDEAGVQTFSDLASLQDEAIFDLQYTEPTNSTRITLPVGHKSLLRALIAVYHFMCHTQTTNAIDWITVDTNDFDTFRVSGYEPNAPLRPYSSINLNSTGRITPAGAPRSSMGGNNVTSNTPSKASNFKKGVKRDKSHYKDFKHERYWDVWNRGFRATAKTHDLANILDNRYIPISQEDCDLFDEQQIFMYAVLEEHLLTDMGKTLVRKYEHSSNAQSIYAELAAHMKNSAAGTIAASTLL